MIRLIAFTIIYFICLGVVSFELKFKDGLKLSFTGWPEFILSRKTFGERAFFAILALVFFTILWLIFLIQFT